MKNIIFTMLFGMCVFKTAAQNNAIFTGGDGDGWYSASFIQEGNAIFTGGNSDGWSSVNFLQPGNDIYTGGIGDGWSSAYRPQGTLPVDFIYFTARKQGTGSVSLAWHTAQEINSAYFDVERSMDALHYHLIGKVNSSIATLYTYTDADPLVGLNYYRLKHVDIDGHFVYTPSRLVQFDELNRGLKYYPNPGKGLLNIELTGAMKNEDKIINISNTSGIVIDQLRIKGGNASVIQVDMRQHRRGIYLIQIITSSASSIHKVLLQ